MESVMNAFFSLLTEITKLGFSDFPLSYSPKLSTVKTRLKTSFIYIVLLYALQILMNFGESVMLHLAVPCNARKSEQNAYFGSLPIDVFQ